MHFYLKYEKTICQQLTGLPTKDETVKTNQKRLNYDDLMFYFLFLSSIW